MQEFLPPRDTVAAFDEDAKEAKTWRELSDAWESPDGGVATVGCIVGPWKYDEICALLLNISEYHL